MAQLTALISLVFTIYALGLVACVVLSWAHHPGAEKPRQWLEQFYLPFLIPLRRIFKPAKLSGTSVDYTPLLLLLCIWVLRELVVSLLLTSIR